MTAKELTQFIFDNTTIELNGTEWAEIESAIVKAQQKKSCSGCYYMTWGECQLQAGDCERNVDLKDWFKVK